MIDVQTYRIRIGYHACSKTNYKSVLQRRRIFRGKQICGSWKMLAKYSSVLCLFLVFYVAILSQDVNNCNISYISQKVQVHYAKTEILQKTTVIEDHNFQARYVYGNIMKQKGIINMHLNIRS